MASLGFAWLGSLGFTQLSFARLLRRSARSARVASLSLASWLAARITGSHHSACVGSRQLWLALLGLRCEPSVTRLRLTCVAGWLALSLSCFAGVAGSLAGACAQLSSLDTLLGLASLARVAGLLLASLAPVAQLVSVSAHLALLGSRCFARVLSVRLTNSTICTL